jgi:hypothetical protein
MRNTVAAVLAAALAITTAAVSPHPTEAAWTDGWFTFGGSATSMTRTFSDGSPASTPVVLYLQKKAGSQKCRAQVTVTSGGYYFQSQWIAKYTRTRARGYSTVIDWPQRVRQTSVTVKTNGRCIFGIYAK